MPPNESYRALNRISVFAHVQKAGGTTLTSILRRNFGRQHLDARPVRGWVYQREQLEADLKLPFFGDVESISGHFCRPFVDYGDIEERMDWFTMLRDPVKRFLSAYNFNLEVVGGTADFETFLADPLQRNYQVQFLAGGEDLETAKSILSEKMIFTGLIERFDDSLVLLRHHLARPSMNIHYPEAINAAPEGAYRDKVLTNFEQWEERILEVNALDQALYDFASTELFPRYVSTFGGERALEAAVNNAIKTGVVPRAEKRNEAMVNLTRRFAYRPMLKVRQFMPGWRGLSADWY